jgi:hypothetical protein
MFFSRKGEKIVGVNQHAFKLGRAAGLFFRGLIDSRMPCPAALSPVGKLDPETIGDAYAQAWVKAIAGDDAKFEPVLVEEEAVACNQTTTLT